MTLRERWTVYPLLILSIGMGLRSRLTSLEEVKAVRCESLTVTRRDGQPVVRLGTSDGESGLVEVCGAEGRPQLAIGANKYGGSLLAWRIDRKLLVAAGFEEDGAGVFLINPANDQRAMVPFVPLVQKSTTRKPSTIQVPHSTPSDAPNQPPKLPAESQKKPE